MVNERASYGWTYSIDLDENKYFPKVRVELHYDLIDSPSPRYPMYLFVQLTICNTTISNTDM